MPTYDYVCDKCGHEYEVFQSMTAKVLTKCPECDEESLRRLIGMGAGIIFKGSGFYETDYKKKAPPGDKKEKDSADTGGKDTKVAKDSGSGKAEKSKSDPKKPDSSKT